MKNQHLLYLLLLSWLIGLCNCRQSISNNTETTLIQAYLATDYQVYPTPSKTLHIRINQKNIELDQFLKGHQSWAYITAWNPNSKVLPMEENKQRNEALVKILQTKGFVYYPGKGVPDKGDWIPEASFLVVDLSKKAAIEIGQQYDQKAIVWGKVNAPATLLFCLPN